MYRRTVVRRILFAVPMLFGIVSFAFLVTHFRDPTYLLLPESVREEDFVAIRHQYGFDRPLIAQYGSYLWGVLHFDLGTSLSTGRAVTADLTDRFPATLELMLLSLTVAAIVGITLGTAAAWFRRGHVDAAVRGYSLVFLSIPEFLIALLLIYFFFFRLGLAPPPTGQLGIEAIPPHRYTGAAILDSGLSLDPSALRDAVSHAILPVVAWSIALAAPLAGLTRSAVRAQLSSDYVRFARACGVPNSRILRYVLKAALPSVVTMLGVFFVLMLGGSIIVESIFVWGGVGEYVSTAVSKADYYAIQGFVLVAGVISLIVFLAVDLIHTRLDPRVRL